MAKLNTWLYIAAGIGLLFVLSNSANAATTLSPTVDYLTTYFPGLAANFTVSADSSNRLNTLIGEMVSRNYDSQQIDYMLAQILHESGMLTNVANYHLMNQNNYAGLTTTSGNYAAYNSIGDFMDAYNGFLTKGANPLGADSLTDFNNRLVQNHYYTANPDTYLADLQTYYNALTA